MRKTLMLVWAVAGCTSSWQRTITTVKPGAIVRLSLTTTEARSCSDRCTELGSDGDPSAVMSCLAACPNAEQKFGRCDPQRDRFPDTICVGAPSSTATVEEAGRCGDRAARTVGTCEEHVSHGADARIVVWLLSMVAIVPVIAVANR